jgi:hypothetical protein
VADTVRTKSLSMLEAKARGWGLLSERRFNPENM